MSTDGDVETLIHVRFNREEQQIEATSTVRRSDAPLPGAVQLDRYVFDVDERGQLFVRSHTADGPKFDNPEQLASTILQHVFTR